MRITGDTIQPSLGSNITVPDGMGINVGTNKIGTLGSDYGAFKGNVVQCKVMRYDTQISGSTGTGVDGAELTGMRVSITPKFSNSLILCQFQVHLEMNSAEWDGLFTVYRNGAVPTGTYAGFNTVVGNALWSGLAVTASYDGVNNASTTPYTQSFVYYDFPGTLNTLTYAPGIKTSDPSAKIFYINRTASAIGGNSNECGVSFSTVWEIAQ